jgi:polyphosphate kinase
LKFLKETPLFEAGLVRDGIILIKLWLTVGREMQLKRFHARRHHPLKHWKLTDFDIMGPTKCEGYNIAQEDIFRFTHSRRCAVGGRAGERQATIDPQRHAFRADVYRLYRQGFFCRRRETSSIDCRLAPRILCNAMERSSKLVYRV